MKSHIKFLFLPLLLVGLAPVAWSAVIVPQTGGGAPIDPAGNSDVDTEATGSALLSTFNVLDGRVTQVNWAGVGGTTGNTINHEAGGDDDGIDVRINHNGTPSYAASANSGQNYNTGGSGDGYQWSGTDLQQIEILFGTASGATFQTFTPNRTVSAAGLVLLNFGAAYDTASDQTVTYYDSIDTVLSTQTFAGTGDSQGGTFGGVDIFTGYISDSLNIAKITIDITRNAGSSVISLDALTFSTVVVPEPSSLALIGISALGCLALRRRRAADHPSRTAT